jgi:polyhydroxybutyrate depolymerase
MRSAAAAFAWEFRKRLQWGLIAFGSYLLVLALFQFVILGPRSANRPQGEMTFAFTVLVPTAFAFMYFLAVFSYGLAGDLAARHSMYPARMFTLPVSTAGLAGWPMFYGAITLASLWLVAALVGFRPSGAHVPLVWPALFGAALIAWLQALAWMPYGLPGLRIVAAVLLLTTIDVVVFTALELEVREPLMVLIMAPQVPLAYLVARYAVARARRGDTPDWRGIFSRLGRIAGAGPGRRRPFLTAAHAHDWLERRQHGASLPTWTGILIPFQVLFLYVVRHEPAVLTAIGLAVMALTPPFLAAFVAVNVGRSSPDAAHAYGLTPFEATRPLRTSALVAAKLRMAWASTLLTWLLVLSAIPLALTLAGTWPPLIQKARGFTDIFGAPRAALLVVLGFLLLLVSTWKQLVQGLAVGLTGHAGLIKASVIVRMSSLVLLGVVLELLTVSRDARRFVWGAVPWLPAIPVFVKVCAAAWIATRLHRERLVGDRALVTGTAAWVATVLALDGVLAWTFNSPQIAHSFLLMLSILAVPVVRPSAVLLALGSNRHRGRAASAPASQAPAQRQPALRAALALVAAPAVLAAAAFVSYQVRNSDTAGFVSSGEERTYRLYVPKSYDAARPTPLVISMHGGGLWGVAQMELSRWNAVADDEGLIVVYPSGSRGGGVRAWRAGQQGGASNVDVRFIAELIDTLRASYNIDPARIYADGLSNGGGMAFRLSCTLSDRIAAVGLVASAQFLSWSACADPRPVPMIAFHGTDDRFTPYWGGTSWVVPDNYAFPSIPTFTETWARRNRCRPGPIQTRIAHDVTRREYVDCAENGAVVLYTIEGGGHTWPGGGPLPEWFAGRTSHSVNAAREAWKFFKAHPLRQTAAGDAAPPR